jgi:putative N-acetylmannosamine-6-phosphate epimerase
MNFVQQSPTHARRCGERRKRIGDDERQSGAQYEISVDGVPRTHRDRQDIALQTARFLKSQKPNSVVKMKDLRTGEEAIVAFKAGE